MSDYDYPGLSVHSRRAARESIINTLMAKTIERPDLISLAAGFVDQETLPVEATHEAIDAIFSNPSQARVALQYGTAKGYLPLREAIVQRMAKLEGQPAGQMSLDTDAIVLTAGSNQLLHLIGEVLLDPGDVVLAAAPSYFVYLGTLQNQGARVVGVATDEEGMIPEAIEDLLARQLAAGDLARTKIVYVTTYYDNPCGISIPAARRAAILEVVQRYNRDHGATIHILEDSAYRELRYDGEDIPSLRAMDTRGETVVYAGTFSKSYSPGIRVGWGVVPRHLMGPIMAQKGGIDFGSPHFNQVLLHTVLEQNLYDEHVAQLRASYRAKLVAMLEAAEEHLAPLSQVRWIRPAGGLYVWCQLPAGMEASVDGRLFETALCEGMLYVPGEYCYPPDGAVVPRNVLRLSFGVTSPDRIREGVAALGRAIKQCQ